MSRDLPAAFADALGKKDLRPVLFYEGQFADGWLRLWTGYGEITWGGRTWTGAGTLLGFGTVEEVQQVVAAGTPITLSGIPVELVEMAIAQARQGAPGRVYLGLFNEEQRNFARGASAVGDPLFWPNSATLQGVTITKVGSGIDFDGQDYADLGMVGTPTGSGGSVGYLFANSRTPVLPDETWTASLTARLLSETSGASIRVNCVEETAPNTTRGVSSSGLANSPADTLLVATRTITDAASNQIRLNFNAVWTANVPVNAVYRIKGLMLNRGADPAPWQAYGATPWSPMVSDPVLFFGGRLDVPEIVDGADTCTITISYESRLIDLTTPRELRFTHESQQILFPSDRAFEYVTSIQDKEIKWGR